MMIPCYECILLAICKQKDGIECDMLANYLFDHIEYDEPNGNISKGVETWDQLRDVFEKYDNQTFVTGKTISTFYVIGPISVEACVRKHNEEKRRSTV